MQPSVRDHNSTPGRERAHNSSQNPISVMEHSTWSQYDFTQKSFHDTMNHPTAPRAAATNQALFMGESMLWDHPSPELLQRSQYQEDGGPYSRRSPMDPDNRSFRPLTTTGGRSVEMHHGSSGLAAPLEYTAQQQPPPCSCRACAYRCDYYNWYYGHNRNEAYYSTYYHQTAFTATEDERPIFRRRISDDSPGATEVAPCHAIPTPQESLGHGECMPIGDECAVDPSDREVEMITSKRHNVVPSAAYDQMEHSPSLLSFPHDYYSSYGYYPYPQQVHPRLQAALLPTHYIYPHPLAPHYSMVYQDPRYMYSYYAQSPHYLDSYPMYPYPIEEAHGRKRKRYDDFLLRPLKDYIIYADRGSSPVSDITASPTPSLSEFEEVQELGRIDKEDLVVDVNSLPVEMEDQPPRIERNAARKATQFVFGNQESLRTVSPSKSKGAEERRGQGGRSDACIEPKLKGGAGGKFLTAIANNISQSSSEQWELDDV